MICIPVQMLHALTSMNLMVMTKFWLSLSLSLPPSLVPCQCQANDGETMVFHIVATRSTFQEFGLKDTILTSRFFKAQGLGTKKWDNIDKLFMTCGKWSALSSNLSHNPPDGVAMGSQLRPALANIFVGFYEKKIPEEEYRYPRMYFRFVDDVLSYFTNQSKVGVLKFFERLNGLHEGASFYTGRWTRVFSALSWREGVQN